MYSTMEKHILTTTFRGHPLVYVSEIDPDSEKYELTQSHTACHIYWLHGHYGRAQYQQTSRKVYRHVPASALRELEGLATRTGQCRVSFLNNPN
jgi:hypothetical protein